MLSGLCLNKLVNSFYLINEPSVVKIALKTVGHSRVFFLILGVCFKAVRAVIFEIFGYVQTDIQKFNFYIEALQDLFM